MHLLTYSPRGIFPRRASRVASSEGEKREETQCERSSLGSGLAFATRFLGTINTSEMGLHYPLPSAARKGKGDLSEAKIIPCSLPKAHYKYSGRTCGKQKNTGGTRIGFCFFAFCLREGRKKLYVWNTARRSARRSSCPTLLRSPFLRRSPTLCRATAFQHHTVARSRKDFWSGRPPHATAA